MASGELLRVWAVRHIGAISRTRSTRLGPLVQTGPFALVRNPLTSATSPCGWDLQPARDCSGSFRVFVVVLALEYHAIVQWEEQLLGTATRKRATSVHAARVPRWVPSLRNGPSREERDPGEVASWRDTLQRTRDSHCNRSRLPPVVDKKPTVLIGALSVQASAPLVHFIDTVRAT